MSAVVRFRCGNCGQPLTVSGVQAGKKSRCPACKWMVTVPEQGAEDSTGVAPADGRPTGPLRDALLLDLPPAAATGDTLGRASDTGEAAYQQLRQLQGGRLLTNSDGPPERRLPWLIDVFLYPLNKPGLTILGLTVGVPLLLRIVLRFFMYLSAAFPPMLVFWVLAIVVHWAALLLFALYMVWYVWECIHDSAAGALRATDTIAATPGLGDLLGRFALVLACAGVCLAPALIYLDRTHSLDGRFSVLYGIGGFVFPMAVLAVVMSESLRGLNPLLLLGSILRTFLSYCFLVPFCYVLCLLLPVAGRYLRNQELWVLGYLLLFLAYYQLLVLAHLLGRFYWRNQERLNWDA